ncbi:MAG: hypothetical protein U0169_22705 [Polyangiaceae bacterium]
MSSHASGPRNSGKTVAIVGTGSVGVAAAFAMFGRRVASTILLVDKDERRARGEAADLMHAQALVGRVDVRAVPLAEVAGAHTIVVTAGANQKRGETRLDLLRRNADVVRDVVRELDVHAPDACIVLATNPVDVLTRIALDTTRRPRSKVFGSGTTLDSARLRAILGDAFGVSPKTVHAHVLGEHGDSQFVNWSAARIGGIGIANVTGGPRSATPSATTSRRPSARPPTESSRRRGTRTSPSVSSSPRWSTPSCATSDPCSPSPFRCPRPWEGPTSAPPFRASSDPAESNVSSRPISTPANAKRCAHRRRCSRRRTRASSRVRCRDAPSQPQPAPGVVLLLAACTRRSPRPRKTHALPRRDPP